MEIEDLSFKIVAAAGRDTEVLGRAATLGLARALYSAALIASPKRTIELRQGARVIESHAPPSPPAPGNPDDRDWIVHRFGKRRILVGTVRAPDRAAAITRAAEEHNIPAALRPKLEAEPR